MVADAAVPEPVARPEFLTAQALATRLCCSERHIYRLAARGALPTPVRLGGLVRWRSVDIDRWIEEGCPASPARASQKQPVRAVVLR